MVRTSGNWLREGQALVLDDVAIAGLEYTLPENWKTLWMDPLPAWLNSVTLKIRPEPQHGDRHRSGVPVADHLPRRLWR